MDTACKHLPGIHTVRWSQERMPTAGLHCDDIESRHAILRTSPAPRCGSWRSVARAWALAPGVAVAARSELVLRGSPAAASLWQGPSPQSRSTCVPMRCTQKPRVSMVCQSPSYRHAWCYCQVLAWLWHSQKICCS